MGFQKYAFFETDIEKKQTKCLKHINGLLMA